MKTEKQKDIEWRQKKVIGVLDMQNTWLFSEEDFLKNSPSREMLTVSQELRTRESIQDFIIKLGMLLKIEAKTILAANVYISRFYMRFPISSSKYFVASAAVAIACKLYDNFRLFDRIALLACQIRNSGKEIDENSEAYWQWKDQLLYREELLLRHLDFDLSLILPYDLKDELTSSNESLETLCKSALSLLEILSSLPVLVAYDAITFFYAMIIFCAADREQHVTLEFDKEQAYKCYSYVLELIEIANDPKCPSHKSAKKRIKFMPKETLFTYVK